MHIKRRGNERTYFSPSQLLWVTARATLALAGAALRSRAPIIHIAKAQPMNGVAGWLAARLAPGRRLYLDCDDYEAVSNRFGAPWQQGIVRWWEDRLPRAARGVTVNTTFLRDRCRQLGVPAERLRLVPNGYDPDRFAPVSAAQAEAVRRRWGLAGLPVVLYLGSLSLSNHPVLLLLEALADLVRRLPAARLWLVGGGDDYERVRQAVAERGLEAAVVITGLVDPAEVPAIYAASDVVVDPVQADDTARARSPLKVVEALACGVPVVTGDIGDRAAMLAGDAPGGMAGLLVAPGSAAALAEALLAVLTDPATRQKLAAGARQAAPRYSWDRLAREFALVYAN
jgi:glycosyltransferase involved in cell wall biosynthesis